jgi:Zn-dependent peptidase ImmA (M78 family)
MDVQERGKPLTSPEFKEKLGLLTAYLVKNLGIKTLPTIKLKHNKNNANDILGYTGYYDNKQNTIVVYVTGRHPKDILRTIAHELIHCWQNEHGNLNSHSNDPQYAQHDPQLRKMEMQAYLLGNILFRDWSDFYKHGH